MAEKMIIVTGTGRSGTSTMAGVLHNLGVDMGQDFIKPNQRNPHGYFENRKIIEAFWNYEAGKIDFSEVVKTINSFRREGWWGFKDPRVADYMEEVAEAFPEAVYIVCTRNRKDTIQSLEKTFGTGKGCLSLNSIPKKSPRTAVEVYERRTANIEKHAPHQTIYIDLEDMKRVGNFLKKVSHE